MAATLKKWKKSKLVLIIIIEAWFWFQSIYILGHGRDLFEHSIIRISNNSIWLLLSPGKFVKIFLTWCHRWMLDLGVAFDCYSVKHTNMNWFNMKPSRYQISKWILPRPSKVGKSSTTSMSWLLLIMEYQILALKYPWPCLSTLCDWWCHLNCESLTVSSDMLNE